MRKRVSPLFAVIVIVFAIVVGAISFMLRLRSYDAAVARESAMLQARAQRQMRSGRRGEMTSRRRSRQGGSASRRGGAEPGRGSAPGAARQPGRAGGPAPTAQPGGATRQPGK